MTSHESARLQPVFLPPCRNFKGGGSLRDVLSVALPMIFTSSIHAAKLFCDRMMMGWHSEIMLSASFLAGLLAAVFIIAVIATGQYASVFVAQYIGAGRSDRVGVAVWQGLLFSLAAGLPLSLMAIAGTGLFDALGHDPILRDGQKSYFSVILATSFFSIAAASMSSFWLGRGRPWMVTWVCVISFFMNIFLNWLFIFGDAGCHRLDGIPLLGGVGEALNNVGAWLAAFLAPFAAADHGGWAGTWLAAPGWALHRLAVDWGGRPQGIFGAAFATGVSESLTLAVFMLIFFSRKNRRQFGTWPRRVFDADLMKRLLRYGMPSGALPFVDILSFAVFNFLLASYGPDVIFAAATAFSVNALAFNPLLGMGGAASILVGQGIGSRRLDLAKRAVRSTRWLMLGYVLCVAVVFVGAPDRIIALFQSTETGSGAAITESAESPESADAHMDQALNGDWPPSAIAADPAETFSPGSAHAMARRFLLYIVLWLAGDVFWILYSSAIRGAGDTRFSMWLILAMSVLLYMVPCLALHGANRRWEWGWGPDPLWVAMILYVTVGGLFFYWRYRHGAWQKMKVIEDGSC